MPSDLQQMHTVSTTDDCRAFPIGYGTVSTPLQQQHTGPLGVAMTAGPLQRRPQKVIIAAVDRHSPVLHQQPNHRHMVGAVICGPIRGIRKRRPGISIMQRRVRPR